MEERSGCWLDDNGMLLLRWWREGWEVEAEAEAEVVKLGVLGSKGKEGLEARE